MAADVAGEEAKVVRGRLLQWEAGDRPLAPLSAAQQDTLFELMEAAAHQPLPQHLADGDEEELAVNVEEDESDDALVTNFRRVSKGAVCLETALEALEWLGAAEGQLDSQKAAPFRLYRGQLEERRRECSLLLDRLAKALEQLDLLQGQFTSVSGKTSALHELSEQLMADQGRLGALEAALEHRLRPFLEVDALAFQLNSPTLAVNSENFGVLLDRLDDATDYLEEHENFKESRAYLSRCATLRARAVALARSFLLQTLAGAASEAAQGSNSAEGNSFALFYGRFQAVVPRVRGVVALLETRRSRGTGEYGALLAQAQQHLVGLRESLLAPSVRASVNDLLSTHRGDHCGLVRAACAFLVHLSRDEHQLFSQFFDEPNSPALTAYLEVLCNSLYDELRPLIIHINHLETLAELCSILRLEMLEEHVQANPEPLAAFGKLAWQLLQDVQERLVFRAHLYLKTDIEQYRAAPGDLAYPEKLEMMESIALSLQQEGGDKQTPCSRTGSSPADLHGMWFPTVRRTLACLSRLYRCVDRAIFQGLSQEALSACVKSVHDAATAIAVAKTPIDAELFEVKHLLILREQIAPFQVDFTIRETSLDFSQVRSAAGLFTSNKGRIFTFGSTNALLELILAGSKPQVKENVRDSRKEVDRQLKMSCEALITHATSHLAQPILGILNKVREYQEAGGAASDLHKQEWARPDRLAEVVSAGLRQLKAHLPSLQRSLQLYLANRETEFILFRPVKNNVVGSFVALQQALASGGYTADQLLEIGCPSAEQVSVQLSLATLAAPQPEKDQQ
ncbi:conserved oligomeric Golgi complex subunit 3 isoform X2 [Neocloeon triangulifer]|uniref:conserved oligomeric Golgi complex subunit 3 isoform X2 n=1 Tax=Neocloeon triangulifer TaxID=2078957 RepID=UPI00286F9CFA|nr:conserved oligomeric Golgi complex subunit 3 isoform X2 [Neocloeon triangulifer]